MLRAVDWFDEEDTCKLPLVVGWISWIEKDIPYSL